jgi:Ni/Co efflux regulator RcnB
VKPFIKQTAFALLAVMLAGPSLTLYAQDHHENHPYVRHTEWKKGYHMKQEDWNRGEKIDYRTYHLNAPPNGYEWREVDGNYVMAAIATGIIASTVIAASQH